MNVPIRRIGRPRAVRVTVVRMPNVQPVHGRNCNCHRCQPREEVRMGRRA